MRLGTVTFVVASDDLSLVFLTTLGTNLALLEISCRAHLLVIVRQLRSITTHF